jgi:hypothetical protein
VGQGDGGGDKSGCKPRIKSRKQKHLLSVWQMCR